MRDFITFSQILNAIVGKPTDAANKDGTVHAKITELRGAGLTERLGEYGYNVVSVADNNLKVSADTERTTASSSDVKLKEIRLARAGTVRVAFDLATSENGQTARGTIYVNGSPVGLVRQTNLLAYATYTEDITVSANALLQLYARATNPYLSKVRNFRVYYTDSVNTPVVITN